MRNLHQVGIKNWWEDLVGDDAYTLPHIKTTVSKTTSDLYKKYLTTPVNYADWQKVTYKTTFGNYGTLDNYYNIVEKPCDQCGTRIRAYVIKQEGVNTIMHIKHIRNNDHPVTWTYEELT